MRIEGYLRVKERGEEDDRIRREGRIQSEAENGRRKRKNKR